MLFLSSTFDPGWASLAAVLDGGDVARDDTRRTCPGGGQIQWAMKGDVTAEEGELECLPHQRCHDSGFEISEGAEIRLPYP